MNTKISKLRHPHDNITNSKTSKIRNKIVFSECHLLFRILKIVSIEHHINNNIVLTLN